MKTAHIDDFKRGWFIGNFEPSLLKGNFEVGLHRNKKGDIQSSHFHKKSTEYNLVISGEIKINDVVYKKGDIFIIEPYTVANDIECLTDNEILIVRDISDPEDKYTYKITDN